MISEILAIIVLVIISIIVIKFILEYGGILIKIVLHLVAGWILLVLVNVLGFNIPINLLTIAVSGFGGVLGTLALVILSFL